MDAFVFFLALLIIIKPKIKFPNQLFRIPTFCIGFPNMNHQPFSTVKNCKFTFWLILMCDFQIWANFINHLWIISYISIWYSRIFYDFSRHWIRKLYKGWKILLYFEPVNVWQCPWRTRDLFLHNWHY